MPKRNAPTTPTAPPPKRAQVAPPPPVVPKDRVLGRFKDKHMLEHNGPGGKKALLEHALEIAQKRQYAKSKHNPLSPPTKVSTTYVVTTPQKKQAKKYLKVPATQQDLKQSPHVSITPGMKRSATVNLRSGEIKLEKHGPTNKVDVGITNYNRNHPYINKRQESITAIGHRTAHERGIKEESKSLQEWKDRYAAKGKPLKSPPF